ncbi:hypothetical protein GGQ87_001363 [Brevundimonas alba]|uniref:Uncharacterized protein n=1 Tax=Brevundimonas alba TaxID=74314 RepID=A0A7X6BNU7_9CAUL|nr:hypothetical protein [Brevundimonas alba]NJC41105.1 hypothetical protein [Brevundimonas alba]
MAILDNMFQPTSGDSGKTGANDTDGGAEPQVSLLNDETDQNEDGTLDHEQGAAPTSPMADDADASGF